MEKQHMYATHRLFVIRYLVQC